MGIQAAIKGISYSWLSEVKTDMTNYVRCVYIYTYPHQIPFLLGFLPKQKHIIEL